ncbi:carbohydrate ABC transporter permease [Pseudothermotoga thermarum]|uniref:Carbohydrate ABC transporter membrane protein 1, CUT1 family n=1 Tax=Pseudothermotoga thermarum DSM 5069 TaxID=688269 RepID=F7YU25_9THEM|nr:sugar ABC transporter permease [Pseudothermotoga thermarum]AEH51610.1 carbohydrate ABC transporter membrane protein 1, CUT1 family [Pseudothermotoga thermarum DSM 5069]
MSRTLKRKEVTFGWAMVGTYLAYTALFWGYPFIWMFVLTFSKWNFVSKIRFVGFQNFQRIFLDPTFWRIFLNTINFLAYLVPMTLIASLLYALALTKVKYLRSFVIFGFLVANVSSGVAYSIMFSNLFAVNGPVNRLIYSLFGVTVPWFSHPQLAIFSICLMIIWKFVGYYGLIIYAGLQAIPQSVIEAARIEGATERAIFMRITLPLLNPSLVTVTILVTTLTFGIFTEPYMITGGGPMQRTMTPLMYMYDTAFRRINPSYATVVAFMTALISFCLVMLIKRLLEKEVSFE